MEMKTLNNETTLEVIGNFEAAYNAVRTEGENTWDEFVKASMDATNENTESESKLAENLEYMTEDGVRQMIEETGAKVIKHHTETAVDYVLVVALDESDAEIAAQEFLDGLDDADKYTYEAGAAYETGDRFVYNVKYSYKQKIKANKK